MRGWLWWLKLIGAGLFIFGGSFAAAFGIVFAIAMTAPDLSAGALKGLIAALWTVLAGLFWRVLLLISERFPIPGRKASDVAATKFFQERPERH